MEQVRNKHRARSTLPERMEQDKYLFHPLVPDESPGSTAKTITWNKWNKEI